MTRQPELDVHPTRRVVLGRTALAVVAVAAAPLLAPSSKANAQAGVAPESTKMNTMNTRSNSWTWIPGEKIEHRAIDGDMGETGGGHWCGERYEGGFITYCAFLPPKVTSAPRSFAQPGAPLRMVENASMLTAGAPSDADLTGSPAFSP
jgi:hypothetical protein